MIRMPAGRRQRVFARSGMTLVVAISALAGGLLRDAPPASAATDTIVVRWNEAALDAVRNSTLGPPMVARALAVVHTCIYDAWAAYDTLAAGTRYGGALRRPLLEHTVANKTKAISYAAYHASVDLFPARRPQLDAFMLSLGYDPNLQPTDTTSPPGVGVAACDAVLAYRHGDASNQTGILGGTGSYTDWTGYHATNLPMVVADPIDPATVIDPNKWQPLVYPNRADTATISQTYLGPHWGMVLPFGLTNGAVHRSPVGPPLFGTAEFNRQHADLLLISANLTDRHKAIAEYWADGPNSETPPGHWNLFAQFVSRRDGQSLDQDVKMFFLVTNAVLDAGIAAWDNKRAYDSVRPITGIRMLERGHQVSAWGGPGVGTQVIDGGAWKPYQPVWFPTPPFPEFASGHSAFSAAAAEVLKSYKGSDTFAASVTITPGSSLVEPGVTPQSPVVLSWPTFSAAADEAGMSRRYGGIHPESGDLEGRVLGRLVGADVWLKATLCFTGVCL